MDQPFPGMFKRIVLSLLLLLTLSGCRLVSFLTSISPTSTPTLPPAGTPEYCAWTWAYGDGSTEFDDAVTEIMTEEGITATVKSSSYGEVNSCGNSFAAMALDVKMDIQVADFSDQDLLADTSDKVFTLLKDNLAISQVNNLGNVNLSFTTPNGSTCYWDQSQQLCAE